MRVRPAGVDDAEPIAEVHVLSWQAGYRGLLPQALLDGLRPARRVPRWAGAVRRAAWPARGVLVAEDAGAVVGFASLYPTVDHDQDSTEVGEIGSFYVLPAVWGRGVGAGLMAAAVRTLGAGGFTSATLWVLESNARAIRFYTYQGWEPDGAARDDVVEGITVRDVRYRRKVSVKSLRVLPRECV
ncbi:GNAT family N-acetyltransferase [Frankia sp. AgB32]|uniref:GNAT family N-acetyltransferase n=1 Tax=Frankia sp. AgB32 TaxID=631119 RepID=UPI00200F2E3F|nr:GNAT family N-acetyltransferase [Frankia sp. AgB32]MCK9897877.1 GNAT family N-acetyltransferase [Frankia sp. AgB32]